MRDDQTDTGAGSSAAEPEPVHDPVPDRPAHAHVHGPGHTHGQETHQPGTGTDVRDHRDPSPSPGREPEMTSSATATIPTATRPAGRRRGLRPDGTLDPRDNSLNLIRLFLSWCVLFSHSFYISGNGTGPVWKNDNLGGWAVIGFFVISGYLITGSRARSDGGKYLINRVARIFPGFVLALVVTAFVYAPIGYYLEFGTIDGFLTTPTTPFNYVFTNLLLEIKHYGIAGTLATAPEAFSWNGSLWTLYYEFYCYIIVGLLLTVPLARRRAWPIISLWVAFVAAWALWEPLLGYTEGNGNLHFLLKLGGYFMGGAVLWVLRTRLPLHAWAAIPALAVALLAVNYEPDWGGQAAAPLFAYFVLWLGSRMPQPNIVAVHDISYGVYVHAWPLTVLVYLLGIHEHGVPVYVAVVTVATVAAATLSWVLVERPCMRLARGRPAFGPGGHR